MTVFFAIFAVLSASFWHRRAVMDPSDNAIISILGPKLSPKAHIILPDDSGFVGATQRWAQYQPPSFRAVVEVATEGDVQETVSSQRACGLFV